MYDEEAISLVEQQHIAQHVPLECFVLFSINDYA